MSKYKKISASEFHFEEMGGGIFVTYTNPFTGKDYGKVITDMELVEKTRSEEFPGQLNMKRLRSEVKR
jgi:hypothetical protein